MPMHIKTLATLGRLSNLPTVWTNILAAAVVAQSTTASPADPGTPDIGLTSIVLLALSLLYIAGMFLNDAFDSDWDREHDNSRPIVSGEISRRSVWVIGYLLLFSGLLLILLQNNEAASTTALALSGAIILYNALHKRFPSAAFIMGFTRFGVYLISALLLATTNTALLLIATGLLLYITGITYLAREEQSNTNTRRWPLLLLSAPVLVTITDSYTLPLYWLLVIIYSIWVTAQVRNKLFSITPDVRAGIGGLLAAIPLVDGLYLASVNALVPAIVCVIVFLLVPRLHKIISGT